MMQHSQMAFWHGSRAKGPQLCWILALLAGCTFIIIIMIAIVIFIGNNIIIYIISYYCFIIINMIIIIIINIVIIFIFIMIIIMHCWQAALALLVQESLSWSLCAVFIGSHAGCHCSLGGWACCQEKRTGGEFGWPELITWFSRCSTATAAVQ